MASFVVVEWYHTDSAQHLDLGSGLKPLVINALDRAPCLLKSRSTMMTAQSLRFLHLLVPTPQTTELEAPTVKKTTCVAPEMMAAR